MVPLPFYHVVFVHTTTVLSVVFNLILLYFIVKHSSEHFGHYKYLMLIFATFNVAYSMVQSLALPAIHIFDMSFLVFATNLDWPRLPWRVLTAVFASLFAQSLYLLSLHFLYRYIQVCRPDLKFVFQRPLCIGLLALTHFLVAFDYGFVCFYNFGVSSEKDEYWREEIETHYGYDVGLIGYIGPLYTLNGFLQWKDLLGIINVGIVISATFGIIPFCGISIYRVLHGHESMSKKTKELQTQMFGVLLIQSAFPLLLTFVPSASVIITSLFGRNIGPRGNIVSLLLTVYPVLDPLVLMYFVNSFRKALLRLLGRPVDGEISRSPSLTVLTF